MSEKIHIKSMKKFGTFVYVNIKNTKVYNMFNRIHHLIILQTNNNP